MTWIICFLVVAAIVSMGLAFLAAARLEAAVDGLEHRVLERLAPVVIAELETKGVKK